MSSFQQEDFHVWKIKIQLARQNSPQAVEELRTHIAPFLHPQHPLLVANFSQLLGDSVLRSLPKGGSFGPYQLYSSVPSFILLKGRAVIQCINLQGDNEIVASCEKGGLLEVSQSQLRSKYGEGNSSLLTKFEVLGQQRSLMIELNSRSLLGALAKVNGQVTLREEVLMRKYMLIALKHISKITYTKGTNINSHFYLLEGKACFYDKTTKQMLCCYQEGLFNPKELNNIERPLYIFEGSYLMLLQEQMLKQEVALGIQNRREQHLNNDPGIKAENPGQLSCEICPKSQISIASKRRWISEQNRRMISSRQALAQKINAEFVSVNPKRLLETLIFSQSTTQIQMSRQNSIKKVLLNAESLKKEVVGCDINSWMETNHKKNSVPVAKKREKQHHVQPMAAKKLDTINDDMERNHSCKMLRFVEKEQPTNFYQKKQNIIETKISKNRSSQLNIPNKQNCGDTKIINGSLSKAVQKSKWKSSNSGYVLAQMRKQFRQKLKLRAFQNNTNSLTQRVKDSLHHQNNQTSLSYYQHRYKKLENASTWINKHPLRA